MTRRVKTIDAHAGGEPLRLVVEGFPAPVGASMLDKRAWVRRRHDRVRRALMREPRGHADMYGAVLTEPVSAGAHAGVLFMHNEGYSTMCGHGVIAVVKVAIEQRLLQLPDPAADIVLDTPAGTVRARAILRGDGSVEAVSFVNVPSFVLRAGTPIEVDGRTVPVDVAFGGAFYAIVDGEAAGVPIRGEELGRLRALGGSIRDRIDKAVDVVHPADARLCGIYGTIFTGPPDAEGAHLRNVTVFADAQVDRSPCGTGTSAVMAVVDAMGLLDPGGRFVHESLIGTTFSGTVEDRTSVGDLPAIVPRIEGRAWITGHHEFVLDDDDPLCDGFLL
jgi:proline racemase